MLMRLPGCGGSPAITVRNTQAAKDAAAREAALAGDATILQLKAQMASVGKALKESEDRKVCLRSDQPAVPGQVFVVASTAQHEVALSAVAALFQAVNLPEVLLQAAQAEATRAAAQDHAAKLAQLQASVKDKEFKMREALARQARALLASERMSVSRIASEGSLVLCKNWYELELEAHRHV